MEGFEGVAEGAIVRNGLGYERPESPRVVKLTEMAELVDDDVVGHFSRHESYFVAKRKIAVAGTASPPRLLVSYSNNVVFKIVVSVPVRESLFCKRERRDFMERVLAPSVSTLHENTRRQLL
jgi:hypothetical protein